MVRVDSLGAGSACARGRLWRTGIEQSFAVSVATPAAGDADTELRRRYCTRRESLKHSACSAIRRKERAVFQSIEIDRRRWRRASNFSHDGAASELRPVVDRGRARRSLIGQARGTGLNGILRRLHQHEGEIRETSTPSDSTPHFSRTRGRREFDCALFPCEPASSPCTRTLSLLQRTRVLAEQIDLADPDHDSTGTGGFCRRGERRLPRAV